MVKQPSRPQVACGWVLPPPPGGTCSHKEAGDHWHRIQLSPGGPSPRGSCCEDGRLREFLRPESPLGWQVPSFFRCFAFWKWPDCPELSSETREGV